MDHDDANNQSGSVKRKRGVKYCCVPQCCQYAEEGFSFHLFPKEPSLKAKWEIALRMGKPASTTMHVCSKHFTQKDFFPINISTKRRKLYPHVVPSQNLPKRVHDKFVTADVADKQLARARRAGEREEKQRSQVNIDSGHGASTSVEEVQEIKPVEKTFINSAIQVNLADPRPSRPCSEGGSFANMLSDLSLQEKCTQVNLLPVWNDADDRRCKATISLPELLGTKEKLFTFTGLHSLDLLDCLTECVGELYLESHRNKKLLPVRSRVVLTMVKIKQNLDFSALGVLFGINRQTCSNYFRSMCPRLARVLKCVIPWPDQSLIRCNLPLSFEKFKSTRIVLDCCEVTIEKCKCLKCRVLTYSQYKKNHNVKFNMGVAPSGLITEVSSAFGGRASDKHIVADSRILDKLDYGDAVMVHKGYQIEKECLERNVKLFRPPFFSQKKQLTREEALSCAEIARARVHIERVFQRLRQFKFLCGPVPWPLAPYFEDVLTIAIGLTNLGPPVMNIDKFM